MRADNDFNRVMREYVTYKYGPIATECAKFYDQLRDKYPSKGFYKGSKNFRAWVSKEIAEYTTANGSSDEQETSSTEQEQEPRGEHVSKEIAEYTTANGSSDEQETSSTEQEQEPRGEHVSKEIAEYTTANGSSDEQETSSTEQEQEPRGEHVSKEIAEYTTANGSSDEQETSSTEQEQEPRGEHEPSSENEPNGNIINAALAFADNEIANIIEEIENGGVLLSEHDDEGIDLDLFEELQGEIEDFDCRLEDELENIIW